MLAPRPRACVGGGNEDHRAPITYISADLTTRRWSESLGPTSGPQSGSAPFDGAFADPVTIALDAGSASVTFDSAAGDTFSQASGTSLYDLNRSDMSGKGRLDGGFAHTTYGR
ncbi:MAG: hypothetical protein AAFQ33_06085 [Pseudomonadota bacterium]